MPTIASCKSRRNGYHVDTGNGEPVVMPAETILRYGIAEGASFNDRRWRQILRESEEVLAYEKILQLLGQRQHTRSELSRKLYTRGFFRQCREAALDKATRLGLVDDAMFARIYAEEKLRVARWGRRRLVGELRKRGVAPTTIEDVLAEFDDDFEPDAQIERASRLAEQYRYRWAKETEPRKRRDKLFRLLAARGFDMSICYRVWESVGKDA